MRNNLKYKKIILLLGDVGALYFSLYLTLLIRYWQAPGSDIWQSHLIPFSIIFIAWIIIFYITDLYNLHAAVNNINFFRLALRSIAISGLLAIAFFYLAPEIKIAPKRNLLIYIFVFALVFYLWRNFFNWLIRSYLPKNNIAIIGVNAEVKELVRELSQKPHLGYNISFIVGDQNNNIENINGIEIIRGVDKLNELITEKKLTSIILTSSPHQSPELRAALFSCLPLGINYIGLSNFYEIITGRVPLDSVNQMWFLENLSEGSKKFFDASKRGYDVILSILILFATIIFWPIIALIIKIDGKGPVFFKQARLGKNGKLFQIIKFRTMEAAGNDFSPTRSSDSRITAFGSFLRKTRLDEIPQMINIFKGEMSFVGPRPERPELVSGLEQKILFYNERMLVKPGITGWDQISGEYHSPSYEDSLKKLQYDLFYIKNRSIYLDLSIILKTIATVISREGV
jgi:exopolysaccharide biosynthesis polyprenyl glycosylphosphotransferase